MSKRYVTLPRTFRINKRILERLEQEAKRQGLSINTLVNKVLGQYVDGGVYVELYGYVVFSITSLNALLRHLNEEALRSIAREAGRISIKETAYLMGLPTSPRSFLEILEKIVCNFAKWANYCRYERGGDTVIVLCHQKGRKWSHFLEEYIKSSIDAFLDIPPNLKSQIKVNVTETSVVLSLPNRLIERDLLVESVR